MKVNEYRKLSIADLTAKQTELSQELFSIRFQLHTGRLENPARVQSVKKDIARVKTLIRENRG